MTSEGLTAEEREAVRRVLAVERCRDLHGYGEGYACAACCSWAEHVAALLAARTAQAEARGREAAEKLDDMVCDAISAVRLGKYDGLTVERHLERLLTQVRNLNSEEDMA